MSRKSSKSSIEPANPVSLGEAIERLRGSTDMSAEDALTLAEIAIQNLAASLEGKEATDTVAARTIERLSGLKHEITHLQACEMHRQRIPMAKSRLRDAVSDTEAAATRIMECAEAIIAADTTDARTYQQTVSEQVMAIFEACAFQDIAGQRLGGVADALEGMERRLGRFVDVVGAVKASGPADAEEKRRENRKRRLILNGPASEGEGISQADIDRVLGS
ncbi:MAG: chemotaxis protein [Pseudomonadota bacterium]|nr:chemotaxis protein [Pseudomonadota bacterium]